MDKYLSEKLPAIIQLPSIHFYSCESFKNLLQGKEKLSIRNPGYFRKLIANR